MRLRKIMQIALEAIYNFMGAQEKINEAVIFDIKRLRDHIVLIEARYEAELKRKGNDGV